MHHRVTRVVAAAFVGHLVQHELLDYYRNDMIRHFLSADSVAKFGGKTAKLYSKTVAPNYS